MNISEREAAFWTFVRERHNIYEKRAEGLPPPWTNDPILRQYSFTNVFRAADRVSQELIRVQYGGSKEPAEIFLRTIIFRMFNLPSTYRYIDEYVGGVSMQTWSWGLYCAAVSSLMAKGVTAYNGAYILPAAQAYGHQKKHENLLHVVQAMIESGFHRTYTSATQLGTIYDVIRAFPLMGDFMASQLTFDLNYSTALDFDEDELVVAGLGAVRGAYKVRPGYDAVKLIGEYVANQDQYLVELGLEPVRLFGVRSPHTIDIQNCFCEFDKYCRVAHPEWAGAQGDGRTPQRIKRNYTMSTERMSYWFPPKWGV